MESKGKTLLKNSALYMICNYLGKILQVLILPIITAYFTVAEYGYYDLVISSIGLIYPLITVQIAEGTFRYIYDSQSEDETGSILSSSFFLVVLSAVLLGVVMWIYNTFAGTPIASSIGIYLFIVLYSFTSYLQKIARGFGRNKVFAYSGVITIFVTLVSQLFVIYFTDSRVDGLFYAISVAYLCSAFYLSVRLGFFDYINLRAISYKCLKPMVAYSLPLVPNSVCWYLVATGNRYIVVWGVGLAANGIFAISNKFAVLVASACAVFQLAWQECVIKENNDREKEAFFSNVYDLYKKTLFCLIALALPAIKIALPFLVAKEYYEAWKYVPFLLYGAMYMAFASFYGAGYLSAKKTKGAFTTTVFAAVVNLVISIGLIKPLGMFAPCIGSLVAYILLLYLRKHQMRSYFYIEEKKQGRLFIIGQCLLTVAIFYLTDSVLIQSVVFVANMTAFLLLLNSYLKLSKSR